MFVLDRRRESPDLNLRIWKGAFKKVRIPLLDIQLPFQTTRFFPGFRPRHSAATVQFFFSPS